MYETPWPYMLVPNALRVKPKFEGYVMNPLRKLRSSINFLNNEDNTLPLNSVKY